MVAYSFAPQFRAQVAALTKRQTIRGPRKRHARPGEPVQLYTAMRTMHCRKLVKVDPICISVEPITIEITNQIDELLASVVIDGRPLYRDEIEPFAAADGFAPIDYCWWRPATFPENEFRPASARWNMGYFWATTHGYGRFSGVLIKWAPS